MDIPETLDELNTFFFLSSNRGFYWFIFKNVLRKKIYMYSVDDLVSMEQPAGEARGTF